MNHRCLVIVRPAAVTDSYQVMGMLARSRMYIIEQGNILMTPSKRTRFSCQMMKGGVSSITAKIGAAATTTATTTTRTRTTRTITGRRTRTTKTMIPPPPPAEEQQRPQGHWQHKHNHCELKVLDVMIWISFHQPSCIMWTLGHGIEIILQFDLPGASRHRLRLGEVGRLFCCIALGCLGCLILGRFTFNSRVRCDCFNNFVVSWKNYITDWDTSSCHIPATGPKTAVGLDHFIFTYGTWSLAYWNFDLLLPAIFWLSCHLSVLWPPFLLKATTSYRIKSCNIFGYK